MLFVYPQVAEERYAICKSCECLMNFFCNDCKCFMPAKVRFGYAECPQGKWGKVDGGQQEEYEVNR